MWSFPAVIIWIHTQLRISYSHTASVNHEPWKSIFNCIFTSLLFVCLSSKVAATAREAAYRWPHLFQTWFPRTHPITHTKAPLLPLPATNLFSGLCWKIPYRSPNLRLVSKVDIDLCHEKANTHQQHSYPEFQPPRLVAAYSREGLSKSARPQSIRNNSYQTPTSIVYPRSKVSSKVDSTK